MFGLSKGFPFASQDGAFLLGLGDVGGKICVVFLLATGAAYLLRRSSASMRHLVWSVAMASFILTPILSASMPKWRIVPSWSTLDRSGPDTTQRQIARLPTQPIEPEVRNPEIPGDTNPTVSAVKLEARLPSRPAAASHPVLPSLSSIAFAVWLSGCCFVLLRTAPSRIVLLRISSSAVPVRSGAIRDAIGDILGKFEIRRRVDACLSDRRGTPMTWGLLHAHLLLPSEASDWDMSRLRAVLLHELAHVKRRDTVTHVFAQLVLAIFWFHPLVWVAVRRLREESEFACDDLVLRSGVKASDYAEILLGILVPRSVPSPALAMAGQSDMEGRLRAILDEKLDRRSISRGLIIAGTIVALLSTASVASLQTSNAPALEENEQSPRAAVASTKESEAPGEGGRFVRRFRWQAGPGRRGLSLSVHWTGRRRPFRPKRPFHDGRRRTSRMLGGNAVRREPIRSLVLRTSPRQPRRGRAIRQMDEPGGFQYGWQGCPAAFSSGRGARARSRRIRSHEGDRQRANHAGEDGSGAVRLRKLHS